jgi:hypothetical protein
MPAGHRLQRLLKRSSTKFMWSRAERLQTFSNSSHFLHPAVLIKRLLFQRGRSCTHRVILNGITLRLFALAQYVTPTLENRYITVRQTISSSSGTRGSEAPITARGTLPGLGNIPYSPILGRPHGTWECRSLSGFFSRVAIGQKLKPR